MRIIRAEKGKPILLGRFAEDDAMRVVFPLDEFASFDIKTIQLANQRNGDDEPYFCVVTKEGNELYWDVQKSDVSKLGLGKCEMIITFGEKGIAKSYIYETRVLESLGEAGSVPPPYQPWVDSVLSEFAFSHKLENITCRYISIPHDSEPHCDSEETEDGLILTFYIPMGADGKDGKDGKDAPLPFIAIYGETTFDEIKGAYDDGRICYASKVVSNDVLIGFLSHLTPSLAEFNASHWLTNSGMRVRNTGVWEETGFALALSITDANKKASSNYPTNKATTDYVDSALAHKMEKHILDFDGTHITENGQTLSFDTIYGWLLDAPDFVVLVHENYAYHPNGVSTEQIVFSCSYPVNGLDTSHRITMLKNGAVTKVDATSENVVNKADAITDLNKDSSVKYPTINAVTDYVADGNNLPKASNTALGGVKVGNGYGFSVDVNGFLQAYNEQVYINNRYVGRPLELGQLDYAVKQALCDGKGVEYSPEEKKSARERIGAEGGEWSLIQEYTLTEDVNEIKISDVNLKKIRVVIDSNGNNITGQGWVEMFGTYTVLSLASFTTASKTIINLEKDGNMAIGYVMQGRNTDVASEQSGNYVFYNSNLRDKIITSNITTLRAYGITFLANTKIKVYGVEAQ